MDAPEAKLPRIAVTPDEAAIVTGRTRTRIFEALKNGEIAGRKDGKAVVIEISELKRWVRSFPTRGRQAMPPQRSWRHP
jgi:excisionase family DNA binding protein